MEYIYNGISAIQCMYHYFVVYFLSGSTFKKMLTGLSTYREVSSRFYFDLFFFKCCIIILLLSIERFNFITKIRLRLKRFSFIISKYLYIYIYLYYTLGTHSLVCKQSVGSLPLFSTAGSFNECERRILINSLSVG